MPDLLTAIHSSLCITFGTTAPYAIGAHRVTRIGFASIPVIEVPVSVRREDMDALVPIVRQRVYAELAERGIQPAAVAFRPSIGGSYRRRKFVDQNTASASHGRSKFGCELLFHFELTPDLAAACDWSSHSIGRLPERGQS